MNNKLINIITSSDSLLARSFPLEHRTLKTRPALAFEVSEGRENPWRKYRKRLQKNATKVAGKLDIKQKSFFVVQVADIFSALEIYSA